MADKSEIEPGFNVWIAAADTAVPEFSQDTRVALLLDGVALQAANNVKVRDLVLLGSLFADSYVIGPTAPKPQFEGDESFGPTEWAIESFGEVVQVDDDEGASVYLSVVEAPKIVASQLLAAVPQLEALDTQAQLTLVPPDDWALLFPLFEREGWTAINDFRPAVEPQRNFVIEDVSHAPSITFDDSIPLISEFRYVGNQLFHQPRLRLEAAARVVGFPIGANEGSTGIELGNVLSVKTVFAPIEATMAAGDREVMTYAIPPLPAARYDLSWHLYSDTYGVVSDRVSTQFEVLPSSDGSVPSFELVDDSGASEAEAPVSASKAAPVALEGSVAIDAEPATKQTAVLPVPDQVPSQGLAAQITSDAFDTPEQSLQEIAPAPDTIEPAAAIHVEVGPADQPAAPPVIRDTRVEQRIILIREELGAPADEATLEVTIDDPVTVRFGDKTFKSPLALDERALPDPEEFPQDYGHALFAALFNDGQNDAATWTPTGVGYQAFRDSPHTEARVELIIGDPALRRHQWEYLRDPRERELALRNRSPLVRRVGEPNPKPTSSPLRVLTAICSPAGMPEQMAQLNIPEWSDAVRSAFEPLEAAGLATNQLATSADLDAEGHQVGLDHRRLNELLADDIDVLHLVCHGGMTLDANGNPSYQLAIDNADNNTYAVAAEELQVPDSLQLVVLAACDGFDPRQSGTGAALGNRLIEQRVPAVISMQRRLHTTTAMLFTERFYHDLARSGRVDMAIARTRRYLQNNPRSDKTDWGVPVLHLGTSDGRIMDLDDEAGARLGDFASAVAANPAVADALDTMEVRAASIDPTDNDAVAAFGRDVAAAAVESQAIAKGQNVAQIDATIADTVRLDPAELASYIDDTTGIRLTDRFCRQVTSALNIGKHIVLIGVPGTGKTTISQAICRYAADKLMSGLPVFATASADWTTFDTVGGYVPTAGGALAFREGVFLNAIGTAGWLALDEVNRADIDKAIGELFTVMAGQSVDLPFAVGSDNVRIVASSSDSLAGWRPDDATSPFHYVVHPNWRIVATMNVFDKASLFSMSNAFMRRLAFIDAGIPPKDMYATLLAHWNNSGGDKAGASTEAVEEMTALTLKLLDVDNSWIMQHRQIGPAIAKDLIEFAYQQHGHGLAVSEAFAEALLLFVLPQFDGLSRGDAFDVCVGFEDFFGADQAATDLVQHRLCDLYPAVADALAERPAEPDSE